MVVHGLEPLAGSVFADYTNEIGPDLCRVSQTKPHRGWDKRLSEEKAGNWAILSPKMMRRACLEELPAYAFSAMLFVYLSLKDHLSHKRHF